MHTRAFVNRPWRVLALTCVILLLVGCAAPQPAAPASATTAAPAPTAAPQAVATTVPAPTAAPAQASCKGIKVALLMPGSIEDGGWNALGYQGLMRLKDEGFDVAFTEKINQADIPAATRGYADKGYQLILGHGFNFATAFNELAPEYPKTSFFVATSPPEGTLPSNIQYYIAPHEYMAYLAGVLAALTTESKVVGFVGGADDPPNCHYRVAWEQAIADTVPGVKAMSIITGDYNDAAKGREAAQTMIGNGADVIWHGADIAGLGAIQAVVDADKIAIGCYSDQSSIKPSIFASSILLDAANIVYSRAHELCAGTFKGGSTWVPRFDEVIRYAYGDVEFNTSIVSAAVIDKIEKEILPKLKDGTIKPARCK